MGKIGTKDILSWGFLTLRTYGNHHLEQILSISDSNCRVYLVELKTKQPSVEVYVIFSTKIEVVDIFTSNKCPSKT